jgi:competence protein ComEC
VSAVASTEEQAPDRLRAHDLRLVPAALVVWLSVLLGLLWAWWAALMCAVLAAALAVVLARAGRSHSIPRTAVAALLVASVATVALNVPRLWHAEHDPLRAPAARGDQAEMRVTVAERPRPLHTPGYAGEQGGVHFVLIAATVGEATASGRHIDSAGRVLLIAPSNTWSRMLPGQSVTARGELAPARPAELTVAVLYVRGPPGGAGPAPWWQRAAESARSALRAAASVLDPEPAGLLPGLVVGDTSALPRRVEEEFEDAGMSHLTAVSGTNLAIIGGGVLFLLRRLRRGPVFSAVATALVLAGFVVLVGPEPSVLRAGVMGGVALLGLALGRERSALPALAVAVAGLVLHDPAMAVSFGFSLSVVATAGLILLAPRWADALVRRGVPAGFAEGLAVPLAAFVVTAPIIAGMAGQLSLVSVAANVLAAPVVAPVTVLGVLAAVLAPLWPGAARLLVRLAGPEADWLIAVAREAAAVPGALLSWPAGWWGGVLAALVVGTGLVVLRRRAVRLGLALVLVLVLLVVVAVRVTAPAWPPTDWAAVVCDVGQGDAVVLSTGEPGRAVVVDTGPQPGPVGACLDRLDVERVPLVVLSHLHADHIAGLVSVFDGRAVGAVAVGPGRSPGWAWRQVAAIAATQRVPLLQLSAGDELRWPALHLCVLGPTYVPAGGAAEDDGTGINNTSVVVRADTAAGRVLLTGDVELAAQADLLAAGADLRADTLKMPHHGSRYVLPEFVAAVSPRVALVSVGAENDYGHPSRFALRLLSSAGVLVARTDTDGDVALVSDGHGPALVRRGGARPPPRRPGVRSCRVPRGRPRRTAPRWRAARPCPRRRRVSSARRR